MSSIIPDLTLWPNRALVSAPSKRAPRHKFGEKFVRGPIPLDWLCVAAKQPGKAFQVAMGLWFRAGINNSNRMRFPMSWLNRAFSVNRTTAYRGLSALEKVGLVSVVRHRGRASIVTLLEASPRVTL
jgi:hypothetical protein